MFLNEPKVVELDYASAFLRGVPGKAFAVAVSKDGQITFFAIGSEPKASITHRSKIKAVCVHPTKRLLALVDGESRRLSVIRFDGEPVFEEQVHEIPLGSPSWFLAGFEECFFDESGDFLWSVAARSTTGVEVQLREAGSWSIVHTVAVEDPFGGSFYSFHPTNRPETVALWLAAGQDGQQVYWLTRQVGNLRRDVEPNLKDTTPPAFSPNGEGFWVINANGDACRFDYPLGHQIGKCESPLGEDDRFDNGYGLCCLNEKYARPHLERANLSA